MSVGDRVAARALPCDGGRIVRGVVIAKLPGLLLLDMPHGAWCLAEGARILPAASGRIASRKATSKAKRS